jgi:hypothetical protein
MRQIAGVVVVITTGKLEVALAVNWSFVPKGALD